ncbi:small nuclear ribonucleoprotein, U11/U12 48KDa subunit L homeolog [Xenopus laevis]|uniref:MGC82837 protein n=1 Tax=Xenopus laevis TaxID=8355 RepID=Q5XH46_XENLA|nr:small nuclear ribonucleoprotein, U11/U12 48KDa subunit L homeolog [Xenopus laevis]AAH84228.1 MGC82837 protein [Xenopus laevis]
MERGPCTLLQEMKDFTEQCQSRLSDLLQELGWTSEFSGGEQDAAVCPFDDNHRMPKSSLEKHIATCRLRKLGYSKEEVQISDTQFYYEKAKLPSVVIDKELQFQIINKARDRVSTGNAAGSYERSAYSCSPVEVPINHKYAICDLKPADRLAIYDYVLEQTRIQKPASQTDRSEADLFEDLAAKINQDDDQNGPKSHLEIMAEMRDYKRRRQSYRAKNVHITKKSYTEIIHDVINVHMEELSSHWRDENNDDARSSVSSSSVRRRPLQRSPSADSRDSGSHRDKQHSVRKRERSRSPHKHSNREKEKDTKKKKARDVDRRHHSHKRRKHSED